MTYCVGILVRDGLVMIADTRTNAGVDNIATFRKLHLFEVPGERIITLATAGNLSASQSVMSLLADGIEDPETGEVETLLTAPSMFRAAQLVGRAIRRVYALDGAEMEKRSMSFDVTMLLGGQIKQGPMRLYQIYSA
ncbi:MAG TPA: peptidase, partial [Microvirga sp.]|nr:peptidase [Microvirga sp.]